MGYYCGIDLASKRTAICVIDQHRRVKKEVEVATEGKTIGDALSGYRGLTCIVEAAPLAEWLCREVEAMGHKISIVCPRKAKVALASQGKKKTDRRDARALAELCRSGWYEAVHRKSAEARDMRSYMTARKQLVQSSGALASAIRGILRAHGIKITGSSDDHAFVDKVKAAAEGLSKPVQQAIAELLQAFELLHGQQRRMYKALQKSLKQEEVVQRLMTIPGVGPATAATFVATIDDPSRFPDGDKVASYLGLVPSVYQSGETEYHGRITKSGDKLLRWLLVEAAHSLLCRSGTPCSLRTWGLKLQAAKGTGKARVAVARRLCGTMWKLWKDGGVFHAEPLSEAA
jgi:transposase